MYLYRMREQDSKQYATEGSVRISDRKRRGYGSLKGTVAGIDSM
jgi:hypothetical protein